MCSRAHRNNFFIEKKVSEQRKGLFFIILAVLTFLEHFTVPIQTTYNQTVALALNTTER